MSERKRYMEPKNQQTILIVEDEQTLANLSQTYLSAAGFRTIIASDGAQAIEMHTNQHPDLILLDIFLPKLDGRDVLKAIRKWSDTPVIIISAMNSEEDRVNGLDLGADDYITKPFSPREVVSRVKSVLRRFQTQQSSMKQDKLEFGPIIIYPKEHRVEKNGETVELTAKEFMLLLTLSTLPNETLSRETLLSRVWGFEYLGDSRTVDVHIGTLRKKIEDNPAEPRYIKTVWRIGYKFDSTGKEEEVNDPASGQ